LKEILFKNRLEIVEEMDFKKDRRCR